MKKITTFLITGLIVASMSITSLASEIPYESLPCNVTHDCVVVAENLIGDILADVKNGTGFQEAWAKANNRIFKAVISNSTSGYGYGNLAAIARNSIWQCRDVYLRPDAHIQTEAYIKNLIADIITETENGLDYSEALKQAYIKIYTDVNPNFDAEETFSVDICYRDIPPVDTIRFTYARKLLQEAVLRRGLK